MYRKLLSGAYWLIEYYSFALQDINYKVTVIEDQDVPLAPSASGGTRFLPITLVTMAVILIGTLVSIYYFRCRHYQKRILELEEDGLKSINGWNLKKLKESLLELELGMVDYQ